MHRSTLYMTRITILVTYKVKGPRFGVSTSSEILNLIKSMTDSLMTAFWRRIMFAGGITIQRKTIIKTKTLISVGKST